MNLYKHTVQYYETDKMGITHHSNYIRWMEEARIDFLKQIGWSYDELERSGIISPVIRVDCQYKVTTTFYDIIIIQVWVKEISGAKLKIGYEMKNNDVVVCTGYSEHCFLNKENRIISIKKLYPEFYNALLDQIKDY